MAKTIALFNNKLIKVANKIGLYPSCCCGETPPECNCPENCVPGLVFSLGGGGNPFCVGGIYYDNINNNGDTIIQGNLSCVGGEWLVAVTVVSFLVDPPCQAAYSAVLPCENDNLPPAGNVNLVFVNGDPNCILPTATITKP